MPFVKKNRLKGTFAVCQGKGTRQRCHSLPCARLGHTANEPMFAVCLGQGTRQRGCVCRVLGPGHMAKGLFNGSVFAVFAVCPAVTTHGKQAVQRDCHQCTLFCRVPNNAHGKVFAVCLKCSTRQTSSLPAVVCRELFAMCYTRQSVCRV